MQQPTQTDDAKVELGHQLDRLESVVRRIGSSSNTSTISVNAGSMGLWIAATCCAVMFALTIAMTVIGGVAYTSTQQRLDRMQDYINAIYMIAPQLKPKESHDGNDKH